jgi:HK97 family phage prohead protease
MGAAQVAAGSQREVRHTSLSPEPPPRSGFTPWHAATTKKICWTNRKSKQWSNQMEKVFRAAQGRQVRTITAELRTAGDEFALVGFAATYNSWSKDLGGFREQIKPGAFTRSIQEKADVKALFNHAPDHILGRTKSGTLTLQDTPRGLRFRCQLDKNSQKHQDVHAAVKRGDIDECSFAFTVPTGGQSWTEGMDPDTNQRTQLRTLTDVDLIDVSVVTYPAYNETDAEARKEERAAAANLVQTHGLKEAAAYLRKAAQIMARTDLRDFMSATDFAGLMENAHKCAETACSLSQRCYDNYEDYLDGDSEGEGDDEALRSLHRMANAGFDLACNYMSQTRARHSSLQAKKQAAKALGRGR